MKQIVKYAKNISGALFAGGLLLSACTDHFESWNINPNEVTPEQMDHDNLKNGAYFTQMEKSIFVVGKDLGGKYQDTEMNEGDIFASYFAPVMAWAYTAGDDHDNYKLYNGWYNAPFDYAYTNVMQPWKAIVDNTDENSPARAMATVVKVLGMSRITDMYGPIPYSKFGTDIHVAYDSQKDVYYQFFEELDDAIGVLTGYHSRSSEPYMEDYDYIYNGNVEKWIKFANTLRLRLAMRVSYVDEPKARAQASAAIDHPVGLMTSSGDNAILQQNTSFSFLNPIWEISESFNDHRMSATMDCYLNGYADPRLKCYFRQAADGNYHGVRNGKSAIKRNKATYSVAASGINVAENDGMQWMDAAEAYFLLAEAKLRLGLGAETVQKYYEEGVRTSFTSKGATGADAYLSADNMNVPAVSYVDPVNGRSLDVTAMVSSLTVPWDETASSEKKLERIMVQKWIALFPDGQEAWSEMRRTGYPGIIEIETNSSGGEVTKGQLISRLKFPTTEYSDNSANTQAAVSLLGGDDKAGTRLWWDTRRR